MKKILNALFVALLAVFTFSSCSDVPAPYEILEPGAQGGGDQGVTGDGTKDKPYSVLAAQQNQNGSLAWVEGYIVGTLENVYDDKGNYAGSKPNFEAPFNITSNILIAASADEKDEKKCLPVKIKNGSDLSNVLNLKDHPENLKGHLLIQGKLSKGFGKPALIDTKAAVFNGKEIGTAGQGGEVNPQPETPQGSVMFFEESFAANQGAFTIKDVVALQDGKSVWYWKSYKDKAYMYASGNVSKVNYDAESWLISPLVDLTKATSAALSFDHAINFAKVDKTKEVTLWAKEQAASDWTQVTIPNYASGDSWTFVSSGSIDLKAYVGKKMQFAFKYTSTTASAAAWEIKNVKLSGEGQKVEGGQQGGGDQGGQTEQGQGVVFTESFGTPQKDGKHWPSVDKYTGWDNKTLKFSDPKMTGSYSNASVRTTSSLDGHIWFASNKESALKIEEFNVNASKGLKLTYEIAANGVGNQNAILVSTDKGDVVVADKAITEKNVYQTVELTLPEGVKFIQFTSTAASNTVGYRIDNVKLISTTK